MVKTKGFARRVGKKSTTTFVAVLRFPEDIKKRQLQRKHQQLTSKKERPTLGVTLRLT